MTAHSKITAIKPTIAFVNPGMIGAPSRKVHQKTALDLLHSLIDLKSQAERNLRRQIADLRQAASTSSEPVVAEMKSELADELALRAIALQREEPQLWTTERKITLSQDFSGHIAFLRSQNNQAQNVMTQLDSGKGTIRALENLIGILQKVGQITVT